MRPRFILFGDSITQQSFSPGGWGAGLTDRYARKADVVLRGYSGYNTRWALFLLGKLFPAGLQDAPALVTIFFGANDAALPDRSHKRQHVPVPEYKANLCEIISAVKSLSKDTLIVLITPPPVYEKALQETAWKLYGADPEEAFSRTNDAAGRYAKACVEAAGQAEASVIDLWTCMQEKPGWQTRYLRDGLHLTAEGNAVVFEKLLEVLNDKGLSFEAMRWDFPEYGDVNADNPVKTLWELQNCGK
ncbi:hypothetical protein GOP47_0014508 [Adiantum capillus-veneris]|uniref:SGNH hydrolase-type esterase domain-containing protein n=1 Tax=Adiantum capillus-veneris TaxID=13818 RepID=A0A9D4ZE85_ADICA|nr:hypothetical protein GOP47_0014508 [Adiantum capillus-veneris]